ncbi:hypothetical protein LguiA_006346 [Lonicera macranthoides]
MEDVSGFCRDDEQIELPPGFRFHPTDEELITHYLSPKVLDSEFDTIAIGEVDLNKVEPWDLPWRAKMGEKEWYFFYMRDRKYPTGLRTNRATDAGYWKATGKDREIYTAKTLVGMKKTLVFYKGRAPKGEKTNWVMHEFRLDGTCSLNYLSKSSKNEWVICRIFQKSSDGKKIPISGLERFTNNCENKMTNSNLPPLLDLAPFDRAIAGTPHVTCFSDPMEEMKPHNQSLDESFNSSTPVLTSPSSSLKPSDFPPSVSALPNSFCPSTQFLPCSGNFQYPGSVWMHDQSILRLLLENSNGPDMEKNSKGKLSQETGSSTDHDLGERYYEDEEYPYTSNGAVDLDCLWNY